MRKIFFLISVFSLMISACSSSKNIVYTTTTFSTANKIVANALQYHGVRYKFGGTTQKGMDCSGVVYVAFGSQNITLPRVSKDMANTGKEIALSKAQKSDLLFFKTNRRKPNINHVGLVVSNKNGAIKFIHATVSNGVIISSLEEEYWKKTFVKAVTVL